MNTTKKLLIPLPSYGFDPSEASIPWLLLAEKGISITFATPNGKPAEADKKMITGESLGIWRPILRAGSDAIAAYEKMSKDPSFTNPIKYSDIKEQEFDALLLPGGHDKGVKEYLESTILQQQVVQFFNAQKPVGAVCHGVVLAARSIDEKTGKSVIHNYKTTALLRKQEMAAYNMTRLWLKDYYLTYPETTVEDEVKSVLADKKNFLPGPTPVFRDDLKHLSRGFIVRDRNYVSARWPGDAYNLGLELIKMLSEK